MPNLYIISNDNGAHVTIASQRILSEILDCKEFVSADRIAGYIVVPSFRIHLLITLKPGGYSG